MKTYANWEVIYLNASLYPVDRIILTNNNNNNKIIIIIKNDNNTKL